MNKQKNTITIIGLGNMGSALAGAYLDNGYRVTVWNRTAEKAAPLAERGAHVAGSVTEAVQAGDLIIVCVLNYEVVDRNLQSDEVTASLKGKTLVNLTSGLPKEARRNTTWAAENEIGYIDGAIFAIPQDIGQEETINVFAGSEDLFRSIEVDLAVLGGNAIHLGDIPAMANAMEGAFLSFNFGACASFIHGAALADSEGLPIKIYTDLMRRIIKKLLDPMVEMQGRFIEAREYPGHIAMLDTYLAASHHIVEFAEDNGIDTTHPRTFESSVKTAVDAGYGRNDLSALFEVFCKRS